MGEVLGCGAKIHLYHSKALLGKRLLGDRSEASLLVNELMVKAVGDVFQSLFEVSEVDYHSTGLSLADKLLGAYLGFDLPAVSVDISAFTLIAVKKMCGVK